MFNLTLCQVFSLDLARANVRIIPFVSALENLRSGQGVDLLALTRRQGRAKSERVSEKSWLSRQDFWLRSQGRVNSLFSLERAVFDDAICVACIEQRVNGRTAAFL